MIKHKKQVETEFKLDSDNQRSVKLFLFRGREGDGQVEDSEKTGSETDYQHSQRIAYAFFTSYTQTKKKTKCQDDSHQNYVQNEINDTHETTATLKTNDISLVAMFSTYTYY